MKFRKINTKPTELDATPMIDVVFLLVMLFMITISFENNKADERIKLPKDALAKPPSVKPEHELVLNLRYQRDDDGNRIKAIPEVSYNERLVEVGSMLRDLQMERRVMETVHGKDVMKEITVLIRADSEVPAGIVQQLIKQCQDAGFSKFSLRAIEEEL